LPILFACEINIKFNSTFFYGTLESVFLWDILGNCVFYQYLMRLSEYKYKLAFALAIIQSRRSGCAIVFFLSKSEYRYFAVAYIVCLWNKH
jgi:hypothetical protein